MLYFVLYYVKPTNYFVIFYTQSLKGLSSIPLEFGTFEISSKIVEGEIKRPEDKSPLIREEVFLEKVKE